jgi:hypothetical protein
MSRSRASIKRPPPKLGQQTGDVLAEVGYSAEDIAELRKDGRSGKVWERGWRVFSIRLADRFGIASCGTNQRAAVGCRTARGVELPRILLTSQWIWQS